MALRLTCMLANTYFSVPAMQEDTLSLGKQKQLRDNVPGLSPTFQCRFASLLLDAFSPAPGAVTPDPDLPRPIRGSLRSITFRKGSGKSGCGYRYRAGRL